MDLTTWATFVAASAALLLIPGPTVLLVLSYALSKGRTVAVASAAGVATGDFIAMTASLAGLGALVAASATLFTLLKWAGAVYLVWLGIRLVRSAPAKGMILPDSPDVRARGVYLHNATVTALNPKSIAFFVAFVPQFVNVDAALWPQFAVLIATFVTLATLNALTYALAAARLRRWITRPDALTWLTRAGGASLIGMGALTATLRRV
ncbi:LysE family translocator [Sagittula salina]|uniref:LysE family translocator n=1 Tax=Sagittula salina TaxID=2820268 RepID=A0A940RYV9_9RHOB|nr:LysE family translocator [Sagittula salina]MBP0481308.1 LysE family translocator [Sagittula salina]